MNHDTTLPAGFAAFRITPNSVELPPCYATPELMIECAATALCASVAPAMFPAGWYYRTEAENFPAGPFACMGDAVADARLDNSGTFAPEVAAAADAAIRRAQA